MANQIKINIFEGSLHKRGKVNKSWKERWFVLNNDFKLKYYESKAKASDAEMLGNDKTVRGIIDLLKVEILKVALYKDCVIPKHVQILSNVKETSANNSGKNNENGSINNIRSYIIHLCLKHRTYVLSANTSSDFTKWLNLFCKYVYGGILFESYGYKEGGKNKSFKRRYFVINEYQQIKYYTLETRDDLKGFIDLNDIHSFNVEDIESNSAPNSNLLELNGLKRTWTLCFESAELLRNWCKLFEKLGLKTAKKFGDEYKKQDTTFFSAESGGDDDIDDDEKQAMEMRYVRSETITENVTKGIEISEYPIQFKIIVDGIGLYTEVELESEVFDHDITDGLFKGKLVFGKYATDKVVQLSNQLYCSALEVEEMGHIMQTPDDVNKGLKPKMTNLKSSSVSISYLDI